MADAPYTFIKHRPGLGEHKRSIKIARVWQHKETGNLVEVRKFQNVVPENYFRIVFWDLEIKHELSMPFEKPRENPFQPPGATQKLMEPCFLDQYRPYENQQTTRV